MTLQAFCESHAESAKQQNFIDPKFFKEYNVKVGLRNPDGSGVLVGLTTVSQVVGYKKQGDDIIPQEGRLLYRGIEIGELVRGYVAADRFGFEEVAYLLLFGALPTAARLAEFNEHMGELRHLRKNFPRDVLQTFRTPDIMNALARSVLTLYGIDERGDDIELSNQIRQAMDLVAKMATLVPYAYYSIEHGFHDGSLIIHRPDASLSTAENFLRLLRPKKDYSDVEAKTLDMALILHADHGGGNNSTFTTRVVSSTLTDMYSAIAASLGSLKGPLHGGANIKARQMLENIRANVANPLDRDQIRAYLLKILKKEAFDGQGKLYGIGHAVYTISDPRTALLRDQARKLAAEKEREEELAMCELIEREAPLVLQEYRKTDEPYCANVDFYSGFVYDCLGIPPEVYTPIFATARTAGWCAHRVELLSNQNKIMRPAYRSVSHETHFVPISERG